MNQDHALTLALEAALKACSAHHRIALIELKICGMRRWAVALGHEQALRLPAAVAERARRMLRAGDALFELPQNTIVLLLIELHSEGHAELAVQRLLRDFETPLLLDERPLHCRIALGVALAPDHANSADLLRRRATAALDRAIASGSSSAHADATADDPLLLEDLRDALSNNELSVEFQPIVAIRSNTIVAVEALARWYCPRRGAISPAQFVPLAEQEALATELTRWSLHAGLRAFAQLSQRRPGLRCHINVSPRAFGTLGLGEQVRAALAIWGVAPTELVLEVTETAVMDDSARCAQVLGGLREVGIGVAIGDFGKGYSSFGYLKDFPATELKIDQSFVGDLDPAGRAIHIVRSMIQLAHNLSIEATCEGVEDALTWQRLQALDCDQAQGYFLGRPLPASAW